MVSIKIDNEKIRGLNRIIMTGKSLMWRKLPEMQSGGRYLNLYQLIRLKRNTKGICAIEQSQIKNE